METVAALRKRFDTYRWSHPFQALPTIEDDGLMLGRGTLLARMAVTRSGEPCLAVAADQERLLALLSAVYGRQLDPAVVKQVARASAQWQRGEKAGAHIELVFARFPRLRSDEDAFRLFLAEELLAQGMTPRRLVRELGFDPTLLKYDPDQPRVPAGNGRDSGRWESGGTSEALQGPAGAAIGRSFLAGAAPSTLESLAAFAARFSVPTAVLGALLIPTPNSGGVVEGTLPDAADIRFRNDGPEGFLRLTTKAEDGSDIVVAAKNQGGLYVDVATGKPIGRDLGAQLYFDFDAVQDAIRSALDRERKVAAEVATKSEDEEPKLCPAPGPDTPHGSSDRAKDYEDDVHARVNPLAPIPRGFAVMMKDPETGRPVYFDDCFRYAGDPVDGDMQKGDLAEGKSTGYEWLIRAGGTKKSDTMDDFVSQAERQLRTAKAAGRGLKWYFAELYAADEVRDEFRRKKLGDIVVAHMPPRKRK